jgi:hypothetical protein
MAPYAQFLLENVPNRDLGWPPLPPIVTFLGLASPGALAVDPSARPAGPLATVTFEEFRKELGGMVEPEEVSYSIKTRFDEHRRPTEVVRTDAIATATTVTKYQGPHMISQEYTFVRPGQPTKPKVWIYWIYDAAGKLAEYRRGHGDELTNHYTNFKRDSQGRIISAEYRQGAKDELQWRYSFKYSPDGRTIKIVQYEKDGGVFQSTTEILNRSGTVSELTATTMYWHAKKPLTTRAAFNYDAQGRLVEQTVDSDEPEGPGMENEPPPGTVSLTYDDARHTRSIYYHSKEASMRSTITMDSAGEATAIALEIGEGDARQTTGMKLECTYDDHGNWTRCQRWIEDAGNRSVTGAWRRVIEYR